MMLVMWMGVNVLLLQSLLNAPSRPEFSERTRGVAPTRN